MQNKQDSAKEIANVELIEWAFEHGYKLGREDAIQGVHIDLSETHQYFLEKLNVRFPSRVKLDLIGA